MKNIVNKLIEVLGKTGIFILGLISGLVVIVLCGYLFIAVLNYSNDFAKDVDKAKITNTIDKSKDSLKDRVKEKIGEDNGDEKDKIKSFSPNQTNKEDKDNK